MWDESAKFDHQGKDVFFVLAGARDLAYKSGAGFFVETLKSEYHEIRSSLEAFAREAVVAGAEDASACGIALGNGGINAPLILQVTMKSGSVVLYKIDRWD